MKAKRLLALALAVMLMLTAFAGCGKKDAEKEEKKEPVSQSEEKTDEKKVDTNVPAEETGITSKESFVNTMSKLLDLSLYMDLSESYNGSYDSFSYRMKYENQKDYDLDKKVRFADGSEITLPVKVAELSSKGWNFAYDSSAGEELKSGYETASIGFKNSSGKQFDSYVYNHTSITTTLDNCEVSGIIVNQYGTINPNEKIDTAIGFTVCGTITENSTLEDIIARLGNPTSVSCYVHRDDAGAFKYSKVNIEYMQDSAPSNWLKFTLSGDKGYITEMSYSADVR